MLCGSYFLDCVFVAMIMFVKWRIYVDRIIFLRWRMGYFLIAWIVFFCAGPLAYLLIVCAVFFGMNRIILADHFFWQSYFVDVLGV